jgi:hypothetical protein
MCWCWRVLVMLCQAVTAGWGGNGGSSYTAGVLQLWCACMRASMHAGGLCTCGYVFVCVLTDVVVRFCVFLGLQLSV